MLVLSNLVEIFFWNRVAGYWPEASQLPAQGREVIECSEVYTLPCRLESRAEIINVSYRMDSAIAPDRDRLQRNA